MRRNTTLEADLRHARLIVTNARADDLQDLLAPVGLDAPFLDALDDAAQSLATVYENRLDLSASKADLTHDVQTASDTLEEQFRFHFGLARTVFPTDSRAWSKLGLDGGSGRGRYGRVHAGWVPQAWTFYRTLRDEPELLSAMETRNVSADEVAKVLADLDALELQIIRRDDEDGRGQALTQRRNRLHEELTDRIQEVRDVARLVANRHGRPQLMERLGYTVTSEM